MIKKILWVSFLLFSWQINLIAQQQKKSTTEKYSNYLFTYFTGNAKADEQIRFAISNDGYNFRALNGNQPVIQSAAISETGGVRDPHILRGADGKSFYMVVTDMVSALGKGFHPVKKLNRLKQNCVSAAPNYNCCSAYTERTTLKFYVSYS